MESVDREKVIKGLERAIEDKDVRDALYADDLDGVIEIMKNALALLKAQEARVMTLDELRALLDEPQVPLVMEERVPVGTWDGGSVVKWCGSLFIQEEYVDDGTVYTNAKTYGKIWRVWTAWPDKATREATPWIS